jgi:Uma2 family endonuclease
MTLSHGHEHYSKLLGQFVEVLTDLLDMPRRSGGSSTLDREDQERALEPDQCYYLENEPSIRDKHEIDLSVDPPPDLAIEVDITRSSLSRMEIYASLGVPEVWRFDEERLRVYLLGAEGRYQESNHSPHFPFLPLGETAAFLLRWNTMDETSLIRAFRRWVGELLAKQSGPSQDS